MPDQTKYSDLDLILASVREIGNAEVEEYDHPHKLVLSSEQRIGDREEARLGVRATPLLLKTFEPQTVLNEKGESEHSSLETRISRLQAALTADVDTMTRQGQKLANAIPKKEGESLSSDPPALTLDEPAVHSLVADVLRDELRGPMGDPIRQLVRELVQNEIARFFATRKLR